jgi:uncharacterized membrane protein
MTTAGSGRSDPLHPIALAEGAGALALAAYVWRFGPAGPIPMHFDLSGHVDRWGDRTQAALALAALTLGWGLVYLLLAAMDRAGAGDSPRSRGLKGARIVLMLVGLLVAAVPAWLVLPDVSPEQDPAGAQRALAAALSLAVLVVGALLGKTPPNAQVGVRTIWARRSRLAWDKSNRLAGRLLFWIGLGGLAATPIAPPAQALPALIVAIVGAGVLAMIESWRVWRADPDRSSP